LITIKKGHAVPTEFTTLQRETLTAIVDTFVASVPREDDPDGFSAPTSRPSSTSSRTCPTSSSPACCS
jgi:hypothetical protein